MSRLGVNFSEVALAAQELVQVGEQPTIEKVREYLGHRGSFSTISKYLKEWREGRSSTKSNTPPPDQVQAAVSAVWEKLHQEAEQSIQEIKNQAHEEIEAANAQAERANTELHALKTEYDLLKNQYRNLSAQKEILSLDYKQAQADYQLLNERHQNLTNHCQEIKLLQEKEISLLQSSHEREINRLEEHVKHEVKLSRELADTLKSHYEDARVTSILEIDKLKVENKKYLDSIKNLHEEKANLKQALQEKIEYQEKICQQLSQAQELIHKQQGQWDNLQDKYIVDQGLIEEFKQLPPILIQQMKDRLAHQIKYLIDDAIQLERSKHKESEHA